MEEEFEEKNYYEIQLNNRQLVLVFIGTIMIGLVIFVLGVKVGKNKKEIELTSLGSELQAETILPVNQSRRGEEDRFDMSFQEEEARITLPGEDASHVAKEKETAEDLQQASSDRIEAGPAKKETATPPKMEMTPPPAGQDRYSVQVASLTSYDAALTLQQNLAALGYDPVFIVVYESNDNPPKKYYRIRVGSFSSAQEAGSLAKKLEGEQKLRIKTWVCKLNQ